MTLARRPGGNADDRGLGAALASAARREGASTRHDARPLAFEEAAIASSASRSTFPEAFSSVSFIDAQADGTAAGGPRAHGEGARRWTLLSRQSLAQDASRAGPPVPRRLYDPEVDGAGQQVRTVEPLRCTRPSIARPPCSRTRRCGCTASAFSTHVHVSGAHTLTVTFSGAPGGRLVVLAYSRPNAARLCPEPLQTRAALQHTLSRVAGRVCVCCRTSSTL